MILNLKSIAFVQASITSHDKNPHNNIHLKRHELGNFDGANQSPHQSASSSMILLYVGVEASGVSPAKDHACAYTFILIFVYGDIWME